MNSIRNILNSWKIVFSNWKYSLLAVIVAILFYELNVLFSNLRFLYPLISAGKISEASQSFFSLSWSFFNFITLASAITIIIISLMIGILVSLISYKALSIRQTAKKTSILATIGIFLGILAPGCAACGVGIISLLGISGAVLSFLPYKGLEISFISIAILSFAIWKISAELFYCKTSFTKGFKYAKSSRKTS